MRTLIVCSWNKKMRQRAKLEETTLRDNPDLSSKAAPCLQVKLNPNHVK